MVRAAARGWSTIKVAGEPAGVAVALPGRAGATGLREEAGRAVGCREAAEATGLREEAGRAVGCREATALLGAEETGAGVAATRLAAEGTLLAAAGGDPVPREAARAAEEATAEEVLRAGVDLPPPAVVDVGTRPPPGVAGTRGRSLGEGAEEGPGITPRRRVRRRPLPRRHPRLGQRGRRGRLDPSVSAPSPVFTRSLNLTLCFSFEALTVHQVI